MCSLCGLNIVHATSGLDDGKTGSTASAAAKPGDDGPDSQQPGFDTVPGSIATAFALASDSFVRGYVNSLTDQDWYRVTLNAGQTYTFAMDGMGQGAIADTFLRLFDAAGVQLEFDDDSGPITCSLLTFTASSSGTYYISAGSFGEGGFGNLTGQYQLTMNDAATPYFPTVSITDIADYLSNTYWEQTGTEARHWGASSITFNVQGLEPERAALARIAFQTWSDVCNLTFVETGGSALITLDDSDPNSAYASSTLFGSIISSSSINVSSDWFGGDDAVDSYTLQTFIHEIGHAIGLGHSGPYNGSATYGVDNAYANNSWHLSIMSYMDQGDAGTGSFRYVLTPEMADILAVQRYYGAPTATRAGDTVYGHGSTAGSLHDFATYSQAPALTIFDSGGNDTLNASGYSQAQLIDLRGGNFSNIGGLTGNIGIYTTAVIENAVGGSGNDTIVGNAADNRLVGGAGNDSLDGGAGTDTADYSAATNAVTVDLGAGTASGNAQIGTDTLANIENATGGAGADHLTGSSLANTFVGGAGNDTLDGAGGADTADYSSATNAVTVDLGAGTATGGAEVGSDTLTSIENAAGGAGDDYLYGTAGANVLSGGAGNDAIYALDGNDTIDTGNGAANYVEASYGNDSVTGGTGGDIVYGGADDDTLSGGDGNDTLSGDQGADSLSGGNGTDLLYVDSTDVAVAGGADADYLVVADAVVGVDISATDIENWYGYSNGDTFNAAGANTLIYMRGGDGADTLTGGTSGDFLFGDGGNDIVTGGDGNDVLGGNSGADQLFGGNGCDLLYVDRFDIGYQGGADIDYMVVQDAANGSYAVGSAGIEYAYGFTGNDTIDASGAGSQVELHGGDGGDTLTGGAGVNVLLGENGNDRLDGFSALTDHFVGGAGADTIAVATGGGGDYFYDFQDGSDAIDMQATGLVSFGQLTIDNTYVASNWYGVGYGTGTLWVNTGGVGTLEASDFLF